MAEQTTIQEAFISGELSPALWGRCSNDKYKFGASTMRNGFCNFQGGYASRAGTAYVGTCKQGNPIGGATVNNVSGGTPVNSGPPRPIPFAFNVQQQYDLEFGDYYMRIVYRGAYVTETGQNVTSITQADPGVITINAHGYSNGDWVYGSGIGGMTAFNGLTFVVQNATTNTFTLTDLFGNVIDTITFPEFTSGGTFARIYTVTTPYAAVDLPYLKFTQSADEMSLTCWNQSTLTEYPPYDLVRNGNTNWTFTATSFAEQISPPTNVTGSVQSSVSSLQTWYSYVVTAIDAATGSESIASSIINLKNNDISVNEGSNTITWSPVAGAQSYNIYAATPYYSSDGSERIQIGVPYGYLGSALGTSFVDSNITPDFTTTPPLHANPFARGAITEVPVTSAGSGLSQATIGYTVNTSTGSGFVGYPIVLNGGLNGFYIAEPGQNFVLGDSITITSSGAIAATGSYTFSANPTNGQTIILNGVTWTFVTSGASGTQTNIKSTAQATIYQLVADLTNSGNSSINVANYSASGLVVNITYGTAGTVGNSYTLAVGTYGGTISAATLLGGAAGGSSGGATVSIILGPETGTYPGVAAYFQERRVYANTQNNPDTYYMSQPGAYNNMDASIPTVDSDAITGTPWGQQVDGIQFMTPMPGGMVLFTGSGGWQLSGGNTIAITPADQDAQPQTRYGCSSTVPPIPVNFHILFVRESDGVVYDLVYNFFANIYTGSDLTVYSSHLFQGYKIVQWAYAEKPYKIVWAVRNDGALLSLTYIAEQQEQGWARHDTNGLYIGVCSIQEPPIDAVYVIVQRYVNGYWLYYHERFDNRIWANVEDCFCVDAGLTYPMTYPDATLYPAAANGTSNITRTLTIEGGTGYTNPVAQAVDSTGSGVGATFMVSLSGTSILNVTPIDNGQNYTPGYTNIVITDPTGTGASVNPIITNYVNFTASSNVFTSGMVGDVLRVGNGRATIVSQTGTACVADITIPITDTIPNDPTNTPVPAVSGTWSVSTPTTIVTGLNHLEGLTVTGLADGGVINQAVVSNGQITLPVTASQITVGLPFLPQLQTLKLDFPSQTGTTQTKRKNIPSVGVRVHDSRGFSVGRNQPDASAQPGQINIPWTGMVQVKELNQNIPMGQPIPLATDDFFINIGPDWNEKGQVAFQQSYPLPMNIDAEVSYSSGGDT